MVRLRLIDGISFDAWVPLDEFLESYEWAMKWWRYRMISLENNEGKVRYINPRMIIYFEEMDEKEIDKSSEQAKVELVL